MKYRVAIVVGSIYLFGCGNQKLNQDPVPIYQTFELLSKEVNETRIINIWTPPSYENGSEKYPVLYMADGGIKEDFPHIAKYYI